MFNLVKKLFIKDYKMTEKPNVRFKYGVTAGIIGIFSNVLLFAGKIAVGLIGNSITVIADAVNNLSDAGSSVITVFGFKMSSKPADKEHPYGHARFEYISGLFVAFIVLAIGLLLAKSSVEKIITPEEISISVITYVVLGMAVAIKLFQMLLYLDFGKAIKSEALRASAMDSRNDIITTSAVLIATAVMQIFSINIDGYMGAAVSIFIIISAIKLIKDTIDPLIGTMPSEDLVNEIKDKLLSYSGVLGIHDLMVHNYGATEYFAFVHVEVDAKVDALVSHDMIDNIERDFMRELNIHMSIHTDPIIVDDPKLDALKARVKSTVAALSDKLTIHDFRMVSGVTHNNLLFDVIVPYEVNITKDEIHVALEKEFSNDEEKYYFVFNVDNSFAL